MTASEKSTGDFIGKFCYKWHSFDFSSKQSFEEEWMSLVVMMKLCGSLLFKNIPLACMTLLDKFKDHINQSLDLMTKNDLYPPKDQTLTVMDFFTI